MASYNSSLWDKKPASDLYSILYPVSTGEFRDQRDLKSISKCYRLLLAAPLPCVPSPPHTVAAGSQSPVSVLLHWLPGLTYGGRHSPRPRGERQIRSLMWEVNRLPFFTSPDITLNNSGEAFH